MCLRKACTKRHISGTGGFCYEHWKTAKEHVLLCHKVGCNTTLLQAQKKIRCSEHKLECKLKDCNRNFQAGTDGFCRNHWKTAITATANPSPGETSNKANVKGRKMTTE